MSASSEIPAPPLQKSPAATTATLSPLSLPQHASDAGKPRVSGSAPSPSPAPAVPQTPPASGSPNTEPPPAVPRTTALPISPIPKNQRHRSETAPIHLARQTGTTLASSPANAPHSHG